MSPSDPPASGPRLQPELATLYDSVVLSGILEFDALASDLGDLPGCNSLVERAVRDLHRLWDEAERRGLHLAAPPEAG